MKLNEGERKKNKCVGVGAMTSSSGKTLEDFCEINQD